MFVKSIFMKKIFIGTLTMLMSICCFCQNAFYDAKKLREFVITNEHGTIFNRSDEASVDSILSKYAYGALAGEKIRQYYRESPSPNPFIKDLIPTDWPSEEANVIKKDLIGNFSTSSIGSLNVTNIADGIAQFLIKRGKEELNVAFFNRMKEFLENPKYPECKTLFPVTTEFLENISAYRYAELIQSLREAFYKDLSNLTVSLNQLIDLPKYKELFKDLPEIRAAVRCSKIVSELSQSEKGILPDSLIHELADLPEWQGINSNLGNSLKLLDIFSQAVRENPNADNSLRWIKLSDLNNLIKDQITLRIFIGLIYQNVHHANIQFTTSSGSLRMDAFMADNVKTIYVISGLIENFSILANDVNRTIKDFRDKEISARLSNDDYYTYISKAINIIEYGFKVANTIKEGIIDDHYIVTARNSNELYKNIYTKNYNNAVMNAYTILDEIFNKIIKNSNLSNNLKNLGPKSEVIEKILKYGNFMASVIKAESGEDVQNALEAAALPAGSYSIKQKSVVNISINGYIGYAWDFNKAFKDLYARGVYAPVGINVTTGSIKKHGLSFTGFVSLLDVGAVAAYRLENGTTETLKQEVRLESIFSPSTQLLIELGGSPLAIGCGWRRTPKLFYSDNSSFITVLPKGVFNLSILIDIPIFTISNRPFEKKPE
jgi:hypothetical protein